MSTAPNIIEIHKVVREGETKWSAGPSERLAAAIAAQVDAQRINIFRVTTDSNVIRIVQGLSRGHLQLELPGQKADRPLNNLPVVYLGDSVDSQKAKVENPERTVAKANHIQIGQYIALRPDNNRSILPTRSNKSYSN